MQRHSIRIKRSWAVLRVSVLLSIFALAVFAADQCKVYKLDIPDTSTLNLKDGEHVIAAVPTDHGKFEARVTVKDKVVSDPSFYINDKLLKEATESRIPKNILQCLQSDQSSGWSSGYQFAGEGRAFGWNTFTTSYGKGCRIRFAKAQCVDAGSGHFYCVARACCTNGVCADWDGIV